MNTILQKFLKPELPSDINLDDPETTVSHARIIRNKLYLYNVYNEYYSWFAKRLPKASTRVIELGSGGGFIKNVIPKVMTSDVMRLPGIDMHFSALDMPFKKQSIDAFVMFNVLHHLKNPEKFFTEVARCLKSKGKLLMVEPANTLWGGFVYQRFHHEPFDPSTLWKIKKGGAMTGANGALPWIIFFRDRDVFVKLFPNLRIKNISFHTPFRYLLSGGLTYKQLLPDWTYPFVKFLEDILSPFHKYLGMYMSIEIEKS